MPTESSLPASTPVGGIVAGVLVPCVVIVLALVVRCWCVRSCCFARPVPVHTTTVFTIPLQQHKQSPPSVVIVKNPLITNPPKTLPPRTSVVVCFTAVWCDE